MIFPDKIASERCALSESCSESCSESHTLLTMIRGGGVEPNAKGSRLPVILARRYIATPNKKESPSPSKRNTVLPVWGLNQCPEAWLR